MNANADGVANIAIYWFAVGAGIIFMAAAPTINRLNAGISVPELKVGMILSEHERQGRKWRMTKLFIFA